ASEKREELSRQNAATAAASAGFSIVSESGEDDPAVTEKIEARRAAKKAKDFALADRIRDELKASGIELTDVPNGVIWKRV
ncbi:MAG: cysteine--tRNA ligase, partial [Oscillospiraceae bacterium]|nr:cysteine--tRNA ligase [Oscillospiraceae bacterium]